MILEDDCKEMKFLLYFLKPFINFFDRLYPYFNNPFKVIQCNLKQEDVLSIEHYFYP